MIFTLIKEQHSCRWLETAVPCASLNLANTMKVIKFVTLTRLPRALGALHCIAFINANVIRIA